IAQSQVSARTNADALVIGAGPEHDGGDEQRGADDLPVVEEVVRAQADRVRLAGVLQKIIGDDEEVLRRQNRLSIVNTHLLGRDRDHPGVHVDGGEVERSGQSLDVDVRLHLRGDDEDQILA
ncbi:hypothetical protein CN983_28595, partial [Bacillus cereus]